MMSHHAVYTLAKKIDPGIAIYPDTNKFITSQGNVGILSDMIRNVNMSEVVDPEEVVSNHIRTANSVRDTTRFSREDVLTKLHPRIMSTKTRTLTADQPRYEICDDIVSTIVIDSEESMIAIVNDDLKRWGMDLEEAMAIALANLSARNNEYIDVGETIEQGHGVIINEMDGYAASRLLLPNLWERFSPELGPEFVAAIPCRDIMILLSKQPSLLARVKPKILQEFDTKPQPITTKYLGVCRDGIFPW